MYYRLAFTSFVASLPFSSRRDLGSEPVYTDAEQELVSVEGSGNPGVLGLEKRESAFLPGRYRTIVSWPEPHEKAQPREGAP